MIWENGSLSFHKSLHKLQSSGFKLSQIVNQVTFEGSVDLPATLVHKKHLPHPLHKQLLFYASWSWYDYDYVQLFEDETESIHNQPKGNTVFKN